MFNKVKKILQITGCSIGIVACVTLTILGFCCVGANPILASAIGIFGTLCWAGCLCI